jgi:hypothetical protein
MAPQQTHWVRDGIIAGVILIAAAIVFLPMLGRHTGHPPRAYALNDLRQIGLAMIQYATDNDDDFMMLATGEGNEIVPAVDPETGEISNLSARHGFAILLKRGYITGYKIFICRSSRDRLPAIGEGPGQMPVDPHQADLARCILPENCCSYGYDITKSHAVSPECAILADKPSDYVVANYASLNPRNMGTRKHNSDNHGGKGQNVYYNDGHVKWATTSAPDDGDDDDIYVGGPGYETSYTDARIIR